MLSDWLQGPYIYELYDSYGYSKDKIALLFVAGFGSSAIFGTFVGGIADKYGRKRLAVYFGIFYGISCFTKLFPQFLVLLFGRILGGISTSLLFSVFEAWMVHEHNSRGFPLELLSQTFSLATFGNGVMAIIAGFIASFVSAQFGLVAPFIVALFLLLLSSAIVQHYWEENYGNSEISVEKLFSGALTAIKTDLRILVLGCIQSFFETSMYVFVFMWTPMLKDAFPEFGDISLGLHGVTFSSFMVMVMFGSNVFQILEKWWIVEKVYLINLLISVISFLTMAFGHGLLLYLSFMVFEICCGLHFTCISTIRGKIIPEHARSAVMNIFRFPLNIMVCFILVFVEEFNESTLFILCSILLGLAVLGQFYIFEREKRSQLERQTGDKATNQQDGSE